MGLADYVVQRCKGTGCTGFAQIATPSATTYSDPGLAAGSYSYQVRARDTAGNLSPFSNAASGAIPDIQPPASPGGLTATAIGYQINLSWGAATDDVAVTGYLLERCQDAGCSAFTQIAAPGGTASCRPLPGRQRSFSYRIRATDAAGNSSPYSECGEPATTPPIISYVQAIMQRRKRLRRR